MTNFTSGFVSLCLAGASLALSIVGMATAQDPARFQVTDLGPLGPDFIEDPDDEGTFGINNNGEVVFSMDVNGQRHAMLWLPNPAYGLPAGNHDLAEPGLFPSFDQPSIARDISLQGKTVGQVGGILAGEGEAMVWDLVTGTLQPLGFLLPDGTWSRAIAISDAEPPFFSRVVGESERLDICPEDCPFDENDPLHLFVQSFQVTLSGGPPVLAPMDAPDCGESSHARDVSTLMGVTRVAGFSLTHAVEAFCAANTPGCPNDGKDAVLWVSPTVPVVLPDLDVPPQFRDSEARGVNTASESVGWGLRADGTLFCRPDGLYWNAALGLTNLGLHMPLTQAGNTSRAEAINNLSLPQVVGWNTFSNTALLWEKQSGTPPWKGTDLNTVIGPCGGPGGTIVLRQAHDINDSSWIVCVGRPDPGTERHAYVLMPIDTTCPWDLNGDGSTGILDLLTLLTAWGPCMPGLFCSADFDCDGSVGILDLLELLANWGPCTNPGSEAPPKTVQECLDRYLNNPQKLEACLLMLGLQTE